MEKPLSFPVESEHIKKPDAGEVCTKMLNQDNFHCLLFRFPWRKAHRRRKFHRRHRFYIGYKVLFTHRVFSLPEPDSCKVSGPGIIFNVGFDKDKEDCFWRLMCVNVVNLEQPVIVSFCTGCHDIFTSNIFFKLRKNPGQRHLRRAGVPRIAYARTKFRLSW